MKLRKRSPRTANQKVRKGVAAVELALVAPLLFLILFSMIETSRWLMGVHAVTGAAREANRVFIIDRDEAAARLVASEFLRQSSFPIPAEDINVQFQEIQSNITGFDTVNCQVQIDYSDISLVNAPFQLAVINVNGFSAMLTESN